jgi:hypothetical protein
MRKGEQQTAQWVRRAAPPLHEYEMRERASPILVSKDFATPARIDSTHGEYKTRNWISLARIASGDFAAKHFASNTCTSLSLFCHLYPASVARARYPSSPSLTIYIRLARYIYSFYLARNQLQAKQLI